MRIAAALFLVAAVAACQPTGVPRCDRNVDALVVADSLGYRFDCTPNLPGAPPQVLGWADHQHRTLYVWPDRTKTDLITTKVMWHELGHAANPTGGETWADGYAWCHKPLAGISYRIKPTNCAPYNI